MTWPAKHIAAIVAEGGGSVELKEINVPKPGEKEVLVKVGSHGAEPD
jgi:D-arabinose 1-dehydrogenase-like Zn-dependent alcohol dehydrogenase